MAALPITGPNLSNYGIAGALIGASGSTTKIMLVGGGTLTGTVDTSSLTNPGANPGTPGGLVKLTDSGPVTWLIPAASIIAVGQ
ncbi:hypothetical protein AB0P21_07050 [Kribbella sp. NPDC056861]|uniref:hypothetical protein n=1 Tax=Kribbella sp. NPDC056861 TaxID=3154857 RepID=UPI0034344A46